MPDADVDLPVTEFADTLVDALREAGSLALSKFGTPIRNWTKGRDSPVCEADIEVDRLLRQRLTVEISSYGWLSEESEDDPARIRAQRVWIVDPIDGTRAFLAGRPDWSISAALVEAGRPIVAAIYVPVADDLFVAVKGKGARLNRTVLHLAQDTGLDAARIAGPKRYLDRLAEVKPRIEMLPKVHSLALRLARVASGVIDVAIASANSHDWDLAAADLIVHEAGGVLTTFDGGQLIYNRIDTVHGALVAAGRDRHAEMIEIMRAGGAS